MASIANWLGSFWKLEWSGPGRYAPTTDIALIRQAKEKQIAVIFLSESELKEKLGELRTPPPKVQFERPEPTVRGELERFFQRGGLSNKDNRMNYRKGTSHLVIPDAPPLPDFDEWMAKLTARA